MLVLQILSLILIMLLCTVLVAAGVLALMNRYERWEDENERK